MARPGNGKTTVAQAIATLLAGTDPIWLPYAVSIGGQIVQVHDPMVHLPFAPPDGQAPRAKRASSVSISAGVSSTVPPSWWAANFTMDELDITL